MPSSQTDTIQTAWDRRNALAAEHSVPPYIKHAGRWCFLRQVESGQATYSARAKEMRTAWRRYQAVEITLPVAEARAQAVRS
jgi:hypothetical protein